MRCTWYGLSYPGDDRINVPMSVTSERHGLGRYFSAVPAENASAYAASWATAFDPMGLAAPYGLRTAEKYPHFIIRTAAVTEIHLRFCSFHVWF
jgi:hypothetical protein